MISKSKIFVLTIMTVVLLIVLSGSTFAVNPPRNETLIVDILTGKVPSPNNFNSWATWVGNDKGLQQLIADPLWMADYTNGEIINVLAKAEPIYSDDFMTMKVNLREGIYWSDGVEFTADDVIYTVELIKKNSGLYYHTQFNQNVEKVYKLDNYTVIFNLKKPNSRFHFEFLDRWGACRILAKHVWEKVEDPLSYNFNPPIGTGPYTLVDYDQTGYWLLYERREDWERTATGQLYGKPAPKYVKFMYYGDASKKVMAQSKHQLDMAELTPESLKVALARNEFERGFYQDFPWAELLHPCVTGAAFNTDKFPYNNKEVRWALNLALDAKELAMTAYNGAVAFSPAFIPATKPYYSWYYDKLEPWLKEFSIEVDGEQFKPYNPQLPFEMAEAAQSRGYDVPENDQEIKELFGYGWWKHAPEIAEKLLLKNGFTRDSNGKWLLPDGTPWEFQIISSANPAHPSFKWAFPMAQQWKEFGINTEARPSEQSGTIIPMGNYEVSGDWPVTEPFGSDPDMYRSFNNYRSSYYRPSGERAVGHVSRWYDEELDEVLNKMEKMDYSDPGIIDLGIEAAKIIIEEMPGISLASYPSFMGWDSYYWTNYPGGDNAYGIPHFHWPNFKFVLPFLEPTGKK